MADDSRRQLGKRTFEAIAHPVFDPPDAFTAATLDQVFGDLWRRPGLSDRERRLLSIAIVGTRGMDVPPKPSAHPKLHLRPQALVGGRQSPRSHTQIALVSRALTLHLRPQALVGG